MPRMGKTEEDWNGLRLGFLKTVQPNNFSKLVPAACNFKNNVLETYLFVSDLWFCHLHVISLLTLSSIAIEGELNWQNLTRWTWLPWHSLFKVHLIIILVSWLDTMVTSSCLEDLLYFCIIGNCFQLPVCRSASLCNPLSGGHILPR